MVKKIKNLLELFNWWDIEEEDIARLQQMTFDDLSKEEKDFLEDEYQIKILDKNTYEER